MRNLVLAVASAALMIGAAGAANAQVAPDPQAVSTVNLVNVQLLSNTIDQSATALGDSATSLDGGAELSVNATNALLVANNTVDITNDDGASGTQVDVTTDLDQTIAASQTQLSDATATTTTMSGAGTSVSASALNIGGQVGSTITIANTLAPVLQ